MANPAVMARQTLRSRHWKAVAAALARPRQPTSPYDDVLSQHHAFAVSSDRWGWPLLGYLDCLR